jgi:hypothetical protein
VLLVFDSLFHRLFHLSLPLLSLDILPDLTVVNIAAPLFTDQFVIMQLTLDDVLVCIGHPQTTVIVSSTGARLARTTLVRTVVNWFGS